MLPVLLESTVGGVPVTVPAYPVFLALAAIVAIGLLARAAPALGVRRRRLVGWAVVAVLAGLAGARALSVALNPEMYVDDLGTVIALSARGFALYGGILAGGVVMVLAARRLGIPFGVAADAGVVPFAVGLALVRVGCFLAGCCAGVESDLPWAVVFPSEAPLGGLLGAVIAKEPQHVHPTQLYELVAVLVAGLASGAVARRAGLRAGGQAAVFAALFLAYRAVAQLLREPSPGAALPTDTIVAGYAIVAVAALAVALASMPALARRWAGAGATRI